MVSPAYLPPPTACERLRTIVERHGGEWVQRSEEPTVDYPLPAHAPEELREFFRAQISAVELWPEFIGRLPGGRVFGSGAVLSPDGKSVARDVSVDFGKPFSKHWLLGYHRIRPPVGIPGDSAVAATALGHGYAHWLLEELPRLLTPGVAECDTVLAHATTGYSRHALDLLHLRGKVREPKRYEHLCCEQLTVPSLIGQPGFPTPRVGQVLQDFVGEIASKSIHSGERLYISREKARRRRVTNEAEVWALLQRMGFEKLHTEDLTWFAQIEVFRRAKIIIAPHGAGLANIVFCRPGTIVIELFNRSYVNGGYWRLAAVQKLEYRAIVPSGEEPLGARLDANSLDMAVDVKELTKTVTTG